MQWLNDIVSELIARHAPGGAAAQTREIIVSSGVSPSGTYHLGTLREVLTAEVVAVELRRRGYRARHLHIVDDLDVFRKVPADVPGSWQQYLGRPLCDVPSPREGDGHQASYADYFLQDLLDAAAKMHLSMEVVRSHQQYRAGYFVPAIEKACAQLDLIRQILREVSGREVPADWSPIQVIENGRIKNRSFKAIDTTTKTITYLSADDNDAAVSYTDGAVKLSWRVDWPARWWQLGVDCEPFGRDHATKGGSYDTGVRIVREVFGGEPPVPVPYNFVNRVGQTKKMSKSAGDVITAAELLTILPVEIVWFFLLRSAPDKLLFFGEGETLLRLFDEFAELQAKPHKTAAEQQLLELCLHAVAEPTVSNVPFSLLVSSYQAALRSADTTLAIIARTEYSAVVVAQADTIRRELTFIDNWLDHWAQDEVKFSLSEHIDTSVFSPAEQQLFAVLAGKVAIAPHDADGAWFHSAIYECRDELGMAPKDIFTALYRLLIDKPSGPRAGWFLSILPRDWLLARLRLQHTG